MTPSEDPLIIVNKHSPSSEILKANPPARLSPYHAKTIYAGASAESRGPLLADACVRRRGAGAEGGPSCWPGCLGGIEPALDAPDMETGPTTVALVPSGISLNSVGSLPVE